MENSIHLGVCSVGCFLLIIGSLTNYPFEILKIIQCTLGLTMAFFGIGFFIASEIKDAIKDKKPPPYKINDEGQL